MDPFQAAPRSECRSLTPSPPTVRHNNASPHPIVTLINTEKRAAPVQGQEAQEQLIYKLVSEADPQKRLMPTVLFSIPGLGATMSRNRPDAIRSKLNSWAKNTPYSFGIRNANSADWHIIVKSRYDPGNTNAAKDMSYNPDLSINFAPSASLARSHVNAAAQPPAPVVHATIAPMNPIFAPIPQQAYPPQYFDSPVPYAATSMPAAPLIEAEALYTTEMDGDIMDFIIPDTPAL